MTIPVNIVTGLAAILILGGIAGLVFGDFSFTTQTHQATIGPLELMVDEKKNVIIPPWAAIAAIIAGIGLMASRYKRA